MMEMETMNSKKTEIFDGNSWVVAVEETLEGEIRPDKSHDPWVVAVEASLAGEMRPDKSHDGLIHTVPKPLLKKKEEFYIPQVISFGPYHFQEKEKDASDDDMKLLKSEVARKMHLKIILKGGLKPVVEKFKKKEKQDKLKECYAKNIELSSEACAWMIVRDACFVLEVLDRFQEQTVLSIEDEDTEKKVAAFIDSILSRKRHHPLLTEIVKDMLKMENQLPFWVLEEIRFDILGLTDELWFESALKKLSPIEVAEVGNRNYNKDSHILQLLHEYIVDRQATASSNPQSVSFGIILRKIKEFIFHTTTSRSISIKWLLALLFLPVFVMLFILGIIFVILYYIKNHVFDILYSIMNCISRREEEKEEHVPSIDELVRGGLKFKKLEGGISHIKFDKSNSTLYLPKFKVDNRSEVILRNLIALEICSQKEEKPITRYAILMNDLVDTSRDVGILRREDIITDKLGNDEEIARLWNCMVTPTEMPRYEFIEKAAESINRYHKKWGKGLAILKHHRLWGKFVVLLITFIRIYCSRPWWFLSGLIGVILLVLTVVQVFCLFGSCQLK